MHFFAHELSLTLIRRLRPLHSRIRRHDPKLATQLRDAANSVSLNTSEGNRRTGRDRLHLFRVALGSAAEVRSTLAGAVAWGYLRRDDISLADDNADHLCAILYKLIHG